jgi:hypothetical protein
MRPRIKRSCICANLMSPDENREDRATILDATVPSRPQQECLKSVGGIGRRRPTHHPAGRPGEDRNQ